MKKVSYYFWIVTMGLWACSTVKKQKQQVYSEQERQVQVVAKADSMQWNGHLGNWSFDVKAGRYQLMLDSSAQQKQRSESSLVGGQRSVSGYLWELLGGVILLLGLFWGIRRWLKQTQRQAKHTQ